MQTVASTEPRYAWLCLCVWAQQARVNQQPLCVWPRCFVIISYVFRNRLQQSDRPVSPTWRKVHTCPGCVRHRFTVNICKCSNTKMQIYKHTYTHALWVTAFLCDL